MSVMSSPTRQKSWQKGREHVSLLTEMAIQKETVSRKLAQLRDQHRPPGSNKPLSQEEAARRVPVTMRQWQRWEGGESMPYSRNLNKIAEQFGFPVAEFFDENGEDAATSGSSDADRLASVEAKIDRVLAVLEEVSAARKPDDDGAASSGPHLRAKPRRARRTPAPSTPETTPEDRPESERRSGADRRKRS